MAISKKLQQALDRYQLAVDATASQVEREHAALEFQVPEKQWPADVKATRMGQIIGGQHLPPRPMLSIPTLDQPTQLVLNQERAADLGVQVHALTEDASDETAEKIQGLYRHIEVDSRAGLARSWAFERAVKAGRGAYRVNKVYDRDSPNHGDQKIVIQRLLYQESAKFDPFATEPDWSDGDWAFVTSWMPWERYKRKYPKSNLSGYDDSELLELGTVTPGWIKGDKASRAVLIAEYWEVRTTTKKAVLLDNGRTALEDAIPEGATVVEGEGAWSGDTEVRTVYWSTINAVEELEPEQEWDGQLIPLIPTIGQELIPFDDERRWRGITEPNMDAARLCNYAASGAVEAAALETKASHALDPEAIEGYESWWLQKNVRNFAYLPYRRFIGGRDLGPPEPLQADASKMQINLMLLDKANGFIHTGTGAYEPTLGQQTPNVRTKGATLALQQQHEQGNSHFLDNHAKISMTYEAKVVIDLIPHVYDRPGRVVRILTGENDPEQLMVNKPYVLDPKTKRPVAVDPSHPQAKHYDLNKGRYGVVVNIGKSYKTRTDQGADELGMLFQAEPQLFSILGDIYLKFRDFPGHMEAAERVKKMLPAPLQDQQDPQAAQQQVAQMKTALDQAHQQLQQAAEIIKTKQVEQQRYVDVAKINADKEVMLQQMKDATALAVAKINAMTKGIVAAQETEDEAIALAQQHAHEATQAELDRQHEADTMRMAAAQQADASAQDHGQALQQGDQGHQQALEQGQQAVDGQLAVQAAAPQPENGSGA